MPGEDHAAEIDFQFADTQTRAWLVQDLKELVFSTRVQNLFTQLGLKSVADLINLPESELWRAQNCGRKTVREIKSFLSHCGLSLNTKVINWDSEIAAIIGLTYHGRFPIFKTDRERCHEHHRSDLLQ